MCERESVGPNTVRSCILSQPAKDDVEEECEWEGEGGVYGREKRRKRGVSLSLFPWPSFGAWGPKGRKLEGGGVGEANLTFIQARPPPINKITHSAPYCDLSSASFSFAEGA